MLRKSLLACAALLWAATGVAAGDKQTMAQSSLEQLHTRIESLKRDLEDTREAHSEAADALKKSERAISESNRKLFELKQQDKTGRAALDALQQKKIGLEQHIATQQQQLGHQIYRQYLKDQRSPMQTVLSGDNPADIAREMQYHGYVARARATLIRSVRHNLTRVEELNRQEARELKQVSQRRAQQEQQRHTLGKEKTERARLLRNLATRIKAQRGEISKLKRDEKRLANLVEKLARAVAPPRARPADKPLQTNELPSAALNGTRFAALKGRLRLPVRGEIANRFGSPREDTGLSWKGLFIRAPEGEEVKSVASGRIVFADWLRGFGNLMIIDHGEGFMSLYGNNQALLRKAGDDVRAGDSIAAVGNSGGNTEHGLYFELRHLSKPFDPLGWSSSP